MCEKPLRLLSPFSPAECAERLRAGLVARRPAWLPRQRPFSVCGITGEVTAGTMVALQARLAYARPTVWLSATLEPAGPGGDTLVRAEWLGLPLAAAGAFPFGMRLGRVQAHALVTFLARTLRARRPRPVA